MNNQTITEEQFLEALNDSAQEIAEKIIEHCQGWENFFDNWQNYSNRITQGQPFFTYYKDTVRFFNDNKAEILNFLVRYCDEIGIGFFELFPRNENHSDFLLGLLEVHGDTCQINNSKNWLVWVTVEAIARSMEYSIKMSN